MEVMHKKPPGRFNILSYIKSMDPNVFTVLLGVICISGAAVVGLLVCPGDTGDILGASLTQNKDPICIGAIAIDNDIANFQSSKQSMGIGKARAEGQDLQQRITTTWLEAGRAKGLGEKEIARNDKYILYLSCASKVVSCIQSGEEFELSNYKTLFRELTGKDSRVTL